MDISAIQPTERVIEMHHPGDDDKLLGVRVSMISTGDPRMKKIKRRIQDERLKREQRGKAFKAIEVEENLHETIFGAMTGWEWYNPTGKPGDKDYNEKAGATFKGEKPVFNKKNVFEVLEALEWFENQLTAELADEKSFFTTSSTS